MDVAIALSAQAYEVGSGLMERAVKDVAPEQFGTRDSGGNPLIWLIGHVTYARSGVVRMCGVRRSNPFGEVFARGGRVGELSSYPAVDAVLTEWRETSVELLRRLPELTDEELSKPAPMSVPIPDKTMRGVIGFLAWHEGYHFGQMSAVRRSLGLPGLAG